MKLISWFKSGKLTAKDKPKDVYQSNDVFRAYKLFKFRTPFNDLRREYYGSKAFDEDEGEDLDRPCSFKDSVVLKKRKLTELTAESEEEGDMDDTGSFSGVELISGILSFKPSQLLSVWKEPGTMKKCITVAIVLPSGVGAGDFFLRVVDSGEFLELTVLRPAPLLQVGIMHRKWLLDDEGGFELYHPKVIGFEQSLRELRSKTSDKVQSVSRISLPFPVRTRIDNKHNLGWKYCSALMLYVDLKAVVENYAIVNDSQAFELLSNTVALLLKRETVNLSNIVPAVVLSDR